MNTRELNFAYKVRHALNETADKLPPLTTQRLASARKIALSRKKKGSPLRAILPQQVFAGNIGGLIGDRFSLIGRMGLALPLLVVAFGLIGLHHHEQQRRIAETADIDAAVLSDELPLSAYTDHGFNAYLANRGE